MKITKAAAPTSRIDGGIFFAGANSGGGFVSYYKDIFCAREIERVYILKGGPGTGKSSFLRQAAKRAEEEGLSVERYACSSDPDSLDGVIIDSRYAIVDGTSPHVMEASLPGARDEIINLGAFWNETALIENREEIELLSKKKSDCYKKAYRYIEAYVNVKRINSTLVYPLFNENKAERAAMRLFSQIKKGGGHSISYGLICSVGMKGRVRYDTYEHFASKVYVIDDHYGTAQLFLRILLRLASQTDTPVRVSLDPCDAESPDALFFPNDRSAFIISSGREGFDGDVRINMRRFVDASKISDIRGEYRLNSRLCDALMGSAIESLTSAGEHHFALEKIYVLCMDFEAKSVFCRNFLDNLFGIRR